MGKSAKASTMEPPVATARQEFESLKQDSFVKTEPQAQVTISQESLARGIAVVARAVPTRTTLPVLTSILLVTNNNGQLEFRATNLEIGIVHSEPAQVNEPLAICVTAKALSDYVNAMPPDTVSLSLNRKTQTLALECSNFKANIKGVESSEFPLIPTSENATERVWFEPEILNSLIARTAFSAAQDDSRPVLTNIQVVAGTAEEPKIAKFITADGFRLSIAQASLEPAASYPTTRLIPAKALVMFSKLLKDVTEKVSIAFVEDRQVIFELPNTTFTAQLGDGNYPDVNAIIPSSFETRVTVNSSELADAIKAQSVFAREASNIMRFEVKPERQDAEGGEIRAAYLSVIAQSADTGDGVTTLDAVVEGKAIEIAFNAKFLKESVDACGSSQVVLEFTSPDKPGVIKPVGRDDVMFLMMSMIIK